MSSKIIFLFVFVVCWSRGHGYFWRRRESAAAASSDNLKAVQFSYNRVRLPQQPSPAAIPFQFEILPPLPVAIQVPQHILPLAMYPAIHAQLQSLKSGHPHGIPFTPPTAPPPPHPQNIPFVKISHAEPPMPIPELPPQTVAAVKFIPCLCGTTKRDKYSKAGYATPTSFGGSHVNSFQPIQLLPCYCPMVRELEPQFEVVNSPSALPETSSGNYHSTTEASKV